MKFLTSVRNEISKVKWLNKKQILQQFVIVNLVSILLLIYFGAIDFVVVGIKDLLN